MLARGALRKRKLADVDEGLQPLGSRVQHLVDHALHRREQPVPRVVAHGEKHVDTAGTRGTGGGGRQRREWVSRALQQVERVSSGARRQR